MLDYSYSRGIILCFYTCHKKCPFSPNFGVRTQDVWMYARDFFSKIFNILKCVFYTYFIIGVSTPRSQNATLWILMVQYPFGRRKERGPCIYGKGKERRTTQRLCVGKCMSGLRQSFHVCLLDTGIRTSRLLRDICRFPSDGKSGSNTLVRTYSGSFRIRFGDALTPKVDNHALQKLLYPLEL